MRAFVFLVIVAATGCSADLDLQPTFIHPDLRTEFELFVSEAAARGVSLDTFGLVLQYDRDLPRTSCGQCSLSRREGAQDRTVLINQEVICWQNEWEKEALVFHELGHCLLGRLHRKDTLANGSPASLMISGDISIYGPCVYAFGEVADCNRIHRRPYYIQELFDTTTAAPDWAIEASTD